MAKPLALPEFKVPEFKFPKIDLDALFGVQKANLAAAQEAQSVLVDAAQAIAKVRLERFADAYPHTLPGLRGCHLLDGAGHWIQRERADAVNALLLDFLRGLPLQPA